MKPIHLILAALTLLAGTSTVQASDPISKNFLFPDKLIVDAAALDLSPRLIEFKNPANMTLRGYHFDVESSPSLILVCMGNSGNASYMLPYARALVDEGLSVVLFSYQGFGRSDGELSVMSLPGDAQAAYNFVVNELNNDPKDIGIFGVSLGSVLALTLAATNPVGAVAVEDVFLPSEMLKMVAPKEPTFAERMILGGLNAVIIPAVDPLFTGPKIKCPVLLMHGVRDQLLPPTSTMRVKEKLTSPARVWLMQGAGHAPEPLDKNDREYQSQLAGFFKEATKTKTLDLLQANIETVEEKTKKKFTAKVTMTHSDSSSSSPIPVQICLANEQGKFAFARMWWDGKDITFEKDVSFRPTRVFALSVHHAKKSEDGGWDPDLSPFSLSLQDFSDYRTQAMRQAKIEYKKVEQGNRISWTRQYTKAHGTWALRKLPDPETVHPRIRPRYAALLADFARGLSQHETLRLTLSERCLPFVPEHPEQYYALGNASFTLGFKSSPLAEVLYDLARRRLENDTVDDAKALLKTVLRIIPQNIARPEITEETIEVLNTESKLPEYQAIAGSASSR